MSAEERPVPRGWVRWPLWCHAVLWVVLAWILGDSPDPYRYYVMVALVLFAALVAIDRRAFVKSAAR